MNSKEVPIIEGDNWLLYPEMGYWWKSPEEVTEEPQITEEPPLVRLKKGRNGTKNRTRNENRKNIGEPSRRNNSPRRYS